MRAENTDALHARLLIMWRWDSQRRHHRAGATMNITYRINAPLSADQFIDLLRRCSLGARRPIEDRACIAGMVDHANLTVSAWDGDRLVGIARSITDFHYACYLSDLAVDDAYQRLGIGRQMQVLMQERLGPRCNLIVVAAPAADDYYAHLGGYARNPRCWVLARDGRIGDTGKGNC
jgi:GNAT superfamily N-acetyltransferase